MRKAGKHKVATSNPDLPIREIDAIQSKLDRLNQFAAAADGSGLELLTAAMLAHEVNNLLTPILFHVEQCRGEAVVGSAAWTRLEKIESGLVRTLDVIRRLVPGEASRNVGSGRCEIAKVLNEATDVLARAFASVGGVRGESTWSRGGTAAMDGVALRQVVVNLLLNAREGLAARTREVGGSSPNEAAGVALTVGIEGADPDRHLAPRAEPRELCGWKGVWLVSRSREPGPRVASGGKVWIEIRDTGLGFEVDHLSAQHESPQYQTNTNHRDGGAVGGLGRDVRRREGLGLKVCSRLVAAAGGELWIGSRVGTGTVARVWLPRVVGESRAAA